MTEGSGSVFFQYPDPAKKKSWIWFVLRVALTACVRSYSYMKIAHLWLIWSHLFLILRSTGRRKTQGYCIYAKFN